MILHFKLSDGHNIDMELTKLTIAGWSGRDRNAVEEHIVELEKLGIRRPSTVPLYYQVSSELATQDPEIAVLGAHSSGEVETFVFAVDGQMYVTLASDHTDRKLEAYGVAVAKQICAKPIARDAWLLSDVSAHWDELVIRSWISENGRQVLYQEGNLSSLLRPSELIEGCTNGATKLPNGHGMSCGTVPAIGGIRAGTAFRLELYDPKMKRSIRHEYKVEALEIVE